MSIHCHHCHFHFHMFGISVFICIFIFPFSFAFSFLISISTPIPIRSPFQASWSCSCPVQFSTLNYFNYHLHANHPIYISNGAFYSHSIFTFMFVSKFHLHFVIHFYFHVPSTFPFPHPFSLLFTMFIVIFVFMLMFMFIFISGLFFHVRPHFPLSCSFSFPCCFSFPCSFSFSHQVGMKSHTKWITGHTRHKLAWCHKTAWGRHEIPYKVNRRPHWAQYRMRPAWNPIHSKSPAILGTRPHEVGMTSHTKWIAGHICHEAAWSRHEIPCKVNHRPYWVRSHMRSAWNAIQKWINHQPY